MVSFVFCSLLNNLCKGGVCGKISASTLYQTRVHQNNATIMRDNNVTSHQGWQPQEQSPFLLFFSYLRSCPMKFKFGEITGLSSLTNLYASPRHRPCCFMMYATVTVAERDTPAWQWTRTPYPCSRASSAKESKPWETKLRYLIAIHGIPYH